MTGVKHTGGCLCGTVRYEAIQSNMLTVICHCRMCQRWTGSAMWGSVTFDRKAVSFIEGVPKIYSSSSVLERGFCQNCGSSLFARYLSGGAFDTVIFIGLGSLDDPEICKPDIHYGVESEISWIHQDDSIPRIRIDVDDPSEQNELFERMIEDAIRPG